MAPETLKRPQLWSTKSDVWSFGVVCGHLLYEVFNDGERPWPNDEPKRIATHIRHGRMPNVPPKAPPCIKKLIAKIWVVSPEQRPTMEDLAKQLKELHKGEFKIKDTTKVTLKKAEKSIATDTNRSLADSDSPNITGLDDELEQQPKKGQSKRRPSRKSAIRK
ncbi:unnamed protein product [Strongylus vulgaris]|uniref:Protein kinase domain-containing protein n=1 Tax=Strongylus vulgaris TaxID=40348 RepID=A0A3P7I0C0_STRVU|nr:unnamed protein product [Strongylus vulgaris]